MSNNDGCFTLRLFLHQTFSNSNFIRLCISWNEKVVHCIRNARVFGENGCFVLTNARKPGKQLKDKLIKYYKWKEVCSECSLGNLWNGKGLVLHVDHKNGNSFDNRIENLRFLCPNCHSQTDTFAGRNVKNRDIKRKIYNCFCGKTISADAERCMACNGRINQKIEWPSNEILQEEVWKYSISEYANRLNVSDNALRRHCRNNNIKIPNMAYSRFLYLGKKEDCERIKKIILSQS